MWQWQDSSPAFADNFIAFIKQCSYLWHHSLRCHSTAVCTSPRQDGNPSSSTVCVLHPKLRMYGGGCKLFYSNTEPKVSLTTTTGLVENLCSVTTGLLQRVCEAGSRPGAEANPLEISHLCLSVLSEETLGKFLMALDDRLRRSHVFV